MAMNSQGPYLIVCPLSVLANWVNEFAKFAPDIPVSACLKLLRCWPISTSALQVLMYHGTIAEREEMRQSKMDQRAIAEASKRKKIDGSNASIPAFPVVSLSSRILQAYKDASGP
jgi:SNF2 family DNA or RNA helicase